MLGVRAGSKNSRQRQRDNDKADAAVVADQFRAFDKDGSGTIDRAELGRLLKKLDRHHSKEERIWNNDHLDWLMSALDRNGDGSIDYTEFVDWIFDSHDEAAATAEAFLDSLAALPKGHAEEAERLVSEIDAHALAPEELLH